MPVYGFLSTYPPTRCGLATFTAALASARPGRGEPDARIVRVDDLVPTGPATPGPHTKVVGDLHPGSAAGRTRAAAELSAADVAIIQHEYGIYGGPDGDEILDLLSQVTAPRIVVLHTVRERPTAHQRWLLDRVAGVASAVVVMTDTARDLLASHYAVDMSKVRVIPHGTADVRVAAVAAPRDRPVILTWGLIGPGKGIEWGIRALAEGVDYETRPRYIVAGQTHPKVLAESGEAYRESLQAIARELGVEADVEIDGRYRDATELSELVASADVVLLPYDSREQTTSGVLVEALAAGKPVVATRFPHAIEQLSNGAGILVDHEDPAQMAAALHRILGDREAAHAMAAAGAAETRGSTWALVADEYRLLADGLATANAA
jgi:glycosyltransferase involved in cell wall biosynthesis